MLDVEIPADSLLEWIRSSRKVWLDGCMISGALEYHDTVGNPLTRLRHCTFLDEVNFEHSVFVNGIELSGCHFNAPARFGDAVFHKYPFFSFSIFEKPAEFTGCSIWPRVDFYGCEFRDSLAFNNVLSVMDTTLPDEFPTIGFGKSRFLSMPDFSNDTFDVYVDFHEAIFATYVNFANCCFRRGANYWGTSFAGYADFVRVYFGGQVSFLNTDFAGHREEHGWDCSASFDGAMLLNTSFKDTDLDRVIFTPDTIGEATMRRFAYAGDLRSIIYTRDPLTVSSLKMYFRENNMRQKEREITCAIRRHDQNLLERVVFDWTSEWGANLLRPLLWLAVTWLLSGLAYSLLLLRPRTPGLFLVSYEPPNSSGEIIKTASPISPTVSSEGGLWALALDRLSVLSWAFFFSLVSTFNLGFRDVNFGRLIRLVLPRKVDFVAQGGVRVISGIQAIASVFLLALLLLSYFGRPFD